MSASTVTSESWGPQLNSPLDVEEVRSLWFFVHGEIMEGSTRRRLVDYWGLCDRHSWAHAIVEIELWQQGAATREGHQPFDVSILLEDLLRAAVTRLAHGSVHRRVKALKPVGTCLVCDDLKAAAVSQAVGGFAGSDSGKLTDEANQMDHTRQWITDTAAVWRQVACPYCAPATGDGRGVVCREHTLDRTAPVDDHSLQDSQTALGQLQQPLQDLINSMTQHGTDPTPIVRASWVMAMGWLHNWSFPLSLVASPTGDIRTDDAS